MGKTMDIKICGLTNIDDAKAARDAGADFLGFVLYSRSPRGISASDLRRIADKLGGGCKLVGVFVNHDPGEVARIASDCGLSAAQLHGDETHRDFAALSVPVWRAVRLHCNAPPEPVPDQWPAARYVVDSFLPGIYGGTGITADWEGAAEIAKRFPVMLAGGLTPENVAEAVKLVHPLGVDAASGVEKEPGKKDHARIKAFISAARKAFDG
jgi:phosphoribosylanthranilate isomerase